MKSKRVNNKILPYALGAIAAGLIAGGIYLSLVYYSLVKDITQQTFKNAQEQTAEVAKKLDDIVGQLMPYVDSIAHMLSTSNLSREEVEALLKKKPIEINGIGIGYLPYKFSKDRRLYGPYFVEKNGKGVLEYIEDTYDYTLPKYDWFNIPLTRGPGFLEPYFGPVSKTIISEYSVPFYSYEDKGPDKKPIGIVFGNQSIKHLNYILSKLYIGTSSYWFIISPKGTIIAHPVSKWVLEEKTIDDLAQDLQNKALATIGKKAAQEKTVQSMTYRNEVSGDESWLFAAAMPKTGWVIFQSFSKSEIPYDSNNLRQRLFQIGALFLLAAMLLLVVFYLLSSRSLKITALCSAILSVLLGLNLVFMWCITYVYPSIARDMQMVKNKPNLYEILKRETKVYRLLADEKEKKNTNHGFGQDKNKDYVSTGIYIDYFYLENGQLNFHAYVWQHYFDGIHDGIERGFIIPKITGESIVKEVVRRKTDDGETILWEVNATIDQDLDYKLYPFDAKTLTIELWHKEFKKQITLIPDFDSYSPLIPRTLPGLPEKPDLPGWYINKTYFGFKLIYPNTYFGMYTYGDYGIWEYIDKSVTPKLNFNIVIQRYLTDIFISFVIPLAVIALLIFIILLTMTSDGGVFKFAGIFFSIVVAQNQLRSKLENNAGLVYFEWFFIFLYILLFIMGTIAILDQLKIKIKWIAYKNNFIAKIIYWPFFLLLLNSVTLFYLY